MKIEHTEIFGFRAALRGMRNPRDSWDNSDSKFWGKPKVPFIDASGTWSQRSKLFVSNDPYTIFAPEHPQIGSNDLELAQNLILRGGDHRKFLRFITVTCDITLPRYVWQEVDTYKVGTVRNSCSTMNTLGKRDLVQDDFENSIPELFLQELNKAVADFRERDGSKAKRSARVSMKDLLPEGFLQKATYLLNYEVGFRMYWSRRFHRLPMWRESCEGSICSWIKSWPYMSDFLIH